MAQVCSQRLALAKAAARAIGLSTLFILATHEAASGHDYASAMEGLYQGVWLLVILVGVPCLGLTIGAVFSEKRRGWLCSVPLIYVLAALMLLGADLLNPWAGRGDHQESRDLHFVAALTFIAVVVGCGIVLYRMATERRSLSWRARLVIAAGLSVTLSLEYVFSNDVLSFSYYRFGINEPFGPPVHFVDCHDKTMILADGRVIEFRNPVRPMRFSEDKSICLAVGEKDSSGRVTCIVTAKVYHHLYGRRSGARFTIPLRPVWFPKFDREHVGEGWLVSGPATQ